jgi:hypothetical protein
VNEPALSMTGELRDELAANDQIDPRDMPVRFSHLKAFGRSAAHARHAMQFDMEPTLAMRLGKGVHSLILGGPVVLLCPTKQRKGKDYNEWRKEQPSDAIVLTAKEFKKSHAMAASVRANKLASQVIYAPESIYEETIFWEQDGRQRRCTPDVRSYRHLVELKSGRDAEPERFRWDAIKMAYHGQLADYSAAMKWQNGQPPRDVYIVAVESSGAHECSVHRLTPGALERGAKLVAGWMAQLIECEQTGIWPGYSSTIVDFDVPLDVDADLKWDDEDDDNQEEES